MEIFQSSFHDQRKGTRACFPLIDFFLKAIAKQDFFFSGCSICHNACFLQEDMAYFNRELITEKVIHAEGLRVFGVLSVRYAITQIVLMILLLVRGK